MRFLRNILAVLVLLAGAAQAEDGVTAQEILVGQVAAMSGPSAQLGQRLHAGIQAHFNFVNSQGGVHGRRLRLLNRDDGYEPERSVAAVQELIEKEKVFALIGTVGTPTGQAVVPVLERERIPLVGMFSGAQSLREPLRRNIFHLRASYSDEIDKLIQHLTTMGAGKIAVFYQNDAYGQSGLQAVEKVLGARLSELVSKGAVERNSTDVSQALKSILAGAPNAIIQVSTYQASAEFIRQAQAKGYKGQFANVSFVGSKALAAELGNAGKGVIVSQVVPFPFANNIGVSREYQSQMQLIGDKDFDFSSMEGFLMAKVFVEGLQRAGRDLQRVNFIAGLESMENMDLGGFKVNFSAKNHTGSSFVDLTVIGANGRFIR